jgi:hypothetical protein
MVNETYTGPQRRTEYRVRYPIASRPRLRLDRGEFEVIDVSEGGIRFHFQEPLDLADPPPLRGTVVFTDGEAAEIEGTLLRHEGNQLAAQLSKRIPYRRIVQEQIRLARKKIDRP